jgi:hypothetical protein
MPDLIDYERYEAVKLERDRLRAAYTELLEENTRLKHALVRERLAQPDEPENKVRLTYTDFTRI